MFLGVYAFLMKILPDALPVCDVRFVARQDEAAMFLRVEL